MQLRTLILAAVLGGAATPALAVTAEDIVALAQAGVTADVLVAVIDADRSVFTLSPEDVLALKNAGVPDAVVVKMLGSAEEFREEAPPPLIVGVEKPARRRAPPLFFAYPIFIGVPVVTAPLTFEAPRGFGRFINDGWVEGRGFGRFINTP